MLSVPTSAVRLSLWLLQTVSVAPAAYTRTAVVMQLFAATTAIAVTFHALVAAAIGATLRSNCSDLPSACCCCCFDHHSEALPVALSPGHCCSPYDYC